jgi:hypothetical protein
MERLTPGKPLRFRLRVNHESKALEIVVTGKDDAEAKGSLSIDDINRLMANLSQCQHALVISQAGGEQLTPPFDPAQPFEGQGGYSLAKLDAIARYKTAVDDTEGTVGLLVLGSTGRLTGYRISPEKARQLAHALLTAADQTPTQPKRSFDA